MTEVPTSARVLGALGRGLITAGVVVLLFVVFQLWGTNIQEARAQDNLRSEFDDVFADAQTQLAAFVATTTDDPAVDAGAAGDDPDELPTPTPTPTSTLPGGFTEEVLRYFFPEGGDAVARIEIPSIGIDKIVVNGVQVTDLRKGPGHYPSTASVGTEGNTSIAGHRTTYGAPFNRIDELDPGDEIHVTSVLGRFTYRVMAPQDAFAEELDNVDATGEGHIIVRPSATWVLGDFDDNRLTLTACHPKLSSRQRIIVAAELVGTPAEAPIFDADIVAAFVGDNATDVALASEEIPDEAPDIDAVEDDVVGDDTVEDDTVEGVPSAASDSADPASPPARKAISLDEGLNGERDAIPGAIAWMLGAIILWILSGTLGRHLFEDRLQRAAVRAAGLAPVAFCLWFSFEMIDRALPAG